jgi:hypothetical protein
MLISSSNFIKMVKPRRDTLPTAKHRNKMLNDQDKLPGSWVACYSKTRSKVFYKNVKTGQSVWKIADVFAAHKQAKDREAAGKANDHNLSMEESPKEGSPKESPVEASQGSPKDAEGRKDGEGSPKDAEGSPKDDGEGSPKESPSADIANLVPELAGRDTIMPPPPPRQPTLINMSESQLKMHIQSEIAKVTANKPKRGTSRVVQQKWLGLQREPSIR